MPCLNSFSINPKSNVLYAYCNKCRLKDSEYKAIKRRKMVDERIAFKDNGTLENLTCEKCGIKPVKEFGINQKTGKPHFTCKPCHEKVLARSVRYYKSEVGKAALKRSKTSGKGKATTKRLEIKRKERRQGSATLKLSANIRILACGLLSSRSKKSATFLKHTAFTSEEQFIQHMEDSCSKRGIDFKNRKLWELDHKIPVQAYDFNNTEDVLRCWSPDNLHALTRCENGEKTWKLLDKWIQSAGCACYPLLWQNRPPTEDMKMAYHNNVFAMKLA